VPILLRFVVYKETHEGREKERERERERERDVGEDGRKKQTDFLVSKGGSLQGRY